MGQRYWVIGGEYRSCRFDEIVPGTEEIAGPFPDPVRARSASGNGPLISSVPGTTSSKRQSRYSPPMTQ